MCQHLQVATKYSKLMCLDYGEVRIGIAFSDLMQIISSPYETYVRKNSEQDLQYLCELAKNNIVGKIIIGLPYNMDGTEGERAIKTKQFGELLHQKSGLEIVYQDERLSSSEAEEILANSKVKYDKRKMLIDKLAASIILQSYMNGIKK